MANSDYTPPSPIDNIDNYTDGDIVNPDDFTNPGLCGDVDCIDNPQLFSNSSKAVFDANMATGDWCHIGDHTNAHWSGVNMGMGTGPEPTCAEVYAQAEATLTVPTEPVFYTDNNGAMYMVDTFYLGACGFYTIGQLRYADQPCGYFKRAEVNPEFISGGWRGYAGVSCTYHKYENVGSGNIPTPPPCPPGKTWDAGTQLCVDCNSTNFEILNNVNFAQLTDENTAISWESQDVKYNQISQSDFVPVDLNNIAHFGDHTCEYIKQPLTINNGEYRYNNTITLKIEFSYIDVRTATHDSKIIINLGGELEIFDIDRIKEELTGDGGLYSYGFGGAIAYIEFPAPAVNPGEFAIAEMWQMGDIILEVIQFGIIGYDPCVKTELYDIEATEEVIECTTVPVPPCIPQYLYNQDLYRRQIVTFKTDIQGLIPQYLDKIMISHSALQWGEAGQVSAIDGDHITLSEGLVDITPGKTIVFRDINGDISGAYSVGIWDEYNIEVAGLPDWVTVNTFYTIQEMATAKEFLVISVKPSGDDVTIECVNYDENIYKDGGC